ncbi:hypothetical protein ACFE04_026377 [Oxalis oulophora]
MGNLGLETAPMAENTEIEEQGSGKDHSPESDDKINDDAETEQKPINSISDEDKKKHDNLLSLPPHGSEVFIGGVPKDASEEDLRDICEPIGEVFEVRIMKDKDTGENKGYAFVTFKEKEVAQKAIGDLHSKELKGKTIRCSLAESKNRLFVGNIPKGLTEDEFTKAIEAVGPGVQSIELIKVKALYVKNIPGNISTDQLKELFSRHGDVTRVVMPPGKAGKRDFAFVHFAERSSALKAVKDSEKYEIDGHALEVVLAKPQGEKKPDPYSVGIPPTHLPHAGYAGFAGAPYAAASSGFTVPGSFQQPMIYGRGPMPTGMQMVPMVLPDGRIGYVLQQPGMQMPAPAPAQAPRPRRDNRSSGGRGSDDGNRGRRYRPY